MSRAALVAGATGLIGTHLVDRLLDDATYTAVHTLGRRPLDRQHPKLTHHVVDFDALATVGAPLGSDDVFCALGTTMRQAGSEAAFRKVDFDYVVALAEATAARGAQQFLLVSSMGADPASRVFYNRVKGEAEAAVQALSFAGIYCFRPSLLTGNRQEDRLGERIGEAVLGTLAPLMLGPLRPYRPIAARDVAQAMVHIAVQQPGGSRVYPSDQIQATADAAA